VLLAPSTNVCNLYYGFIKIKFNCFVGKKDGRVGRLDEKNEGK
jgi:hypothetical protein